MLKAKLILLGVKILMWGVALGLGIWYLSSSLSGASLTYTSVDNFLVAAGVQNGDIATANGCFMCRYVADLFGVSSYTLSRLFKNQIGVGFTEYLVSKRIEYAKELLLTTSYSISEVAVMSGFSGIKYFSSAFKLYVGASPSAFRKKD